MVRALFSSSVAVPPEEGCAVSGSMSPETDSSEPDRRMAAVSSSVMRWPPEAVSVPGVGAVSVTAGASVPARMFVPVSRLVSSTVEASMTTDSSIASIRFFMTFPPVR